MDEIFEMEFTMKKTIRIIIPIALVLAIILCSAWYLLIYDREFTRDIFVAGARFSENQGNHELATWLYSIAYSHAGNSDDVALELAQQYKDIGNFTKAEYTLSNAIANGGGIDLYIALCKTYVEQDKLLSALDMLNGITDPEIRQQIDEMRPEAPTSLPAPGYYRQYISVTVDAGSNTLYVSDDGECPSVKDTYTEAIPLRGGETNIHAIAVNEKGLVSPMSVLGYTVGGVIELVEFSDPAMENAIRTTLNVTEEKDLYTDDLWTIKTFTVPANAKDYTDLKHMIHLEELTIENGVSGHLSNIASFSELRKLTVKNTDVSQEELGVIGTLPALEELTLTNAGLSGIAPLSSAVSIKILDLSDNTIRNIDAIKGMSALTALNLHSNAVTDVSALSGNTKLTSLDISSNNLTSLSPLSGLSTLTSVNASTNVLTDLGDIGKLKGLKSLFLSSNKLTNVAAIAALTELTELNISTNELADITALSTLNKLTNFDFSGNKITAIPKFSKDCALVTISGSNNQISTLEPLSGLENLNIVNMDYNTEISTVQPLANCPVLIKVNVFATKVTEVTVLTDQSIEVNFNPVQDR